MADTQEKVKSVEELQAEKAAMEAEAEKHRSTLAADVERLRGELEALRRQALKTPVCPACGSDQHRHCRPSAHHGGPSEARDSAEQAN